MRALKPSKDIRASIYTISKCACLALHTHVHIWKQKHFFTIGKSLIRYHQRSILTIQCLFSGKQPGYTTRDIERGKEKWVRAIDPQILQPKWQPRKLPSLKVEAVLIWEDSLVRGEPLTLP